MDAILFCKYLSLTATALLLSASLRKKAFCPEILKEIPAARYVLCAVFLLICTIHGDDISFITAVIIGGIDTLIYIIPSEYLVLDLILVLAHSPQWYGLVPGILSVGILYIISKRQGKDAASPYDLIFLSATLLRMTLTEGFYAFAFFFILYGITAIIKKKAAPEKESRVALAPIIVAACITAEIACRYYLL